VTAPIVAMTREMGSLGTFIGLEVARALGHEFVRDEIVRRAASEYRVMESGLVGSVERRTRWLELGGRSGRRHRAYLEAAVLETARRERVVLMGRWSTLFLGGVRHAIRVRVCAPLSIRVRRVMERYRVEEEEARRRIAGYDENVRARIRQMFDVDWTDPLLYDLVINTASVSVPSGARQVLALAAAPEFEATEESRADLADRALAARVRATLGAAAATARVELAVAAARGAVRLSGVVASEEEREAALAVAAAVAGVIDVADEIKVFRRPVR
jgi:cytidylate kinase